MSVTKEQHGVQHAFMENRLVLGKSLNTLPDLGGFNQRSRTITCDTESELYLIHSVVGLDPSVTMKFLLLTLAMNLQSGGQTGKGMRVS